MKIISKYEFFHLWKLGVLGNRTELWDDPIEAVESGYPKIGFREVGKAGGGAWELVNREDTLSTASRWTSLGRKFIMDSSVPNSHSTLQGEVCRTFKGLESYLAVGFPLEPMRKTLAAGLHKHRGYLETKLLLDKYMDPSSRDDLDIFLEMYPDATIEITCFNIDVGNIPGRNVMMWEIRDF